MLWLKIVDHIPRERRHTIGARIENKFLDLLEKSYLAYFSDRENKPVKISESILILDTLKFITVVAWEAKIIPNNHYQEIALKLDEIGKMFGGWKNSLNNPAKKNRAL